MSSVQSHQTSNPNSIAQAATIAALSGGTEEIDAMRTIVNQKYDLRIQDYKNGRKHWETNLSLIMMLRGHKPAIQNETTKNSF